MRILLKLSGEALAGGNIRKVSVVMDSSETK